MKKKKKHTQYINKTVREMLFNFAETGKAEGWIVKRKGKTGKFILFSKDNVYDKNTGITSAHQAHEVIVLWKFPVTKASIIAWSSHKKSLKELI